MKYENFGYTGNTGTQNFDVFPSRLCAHQISERLQSRWLNIIKPDIMIDPNKIRLDSVKDSVVGSTARKYVSKARNVREICMKRNRLPMGVKTAIRNWTPKQEKKGYHIPKQEMKDSSIAEWPSRTLSSLEH